MACPVLYLRMFFRRKKNKSGSLSIQVVESNRSGYKVIKSFGVSNDESELRSLERKAQQWIDDQRGPKLPFTWEKDDIISDFMSTLANSQVRIHGPELVYGSLYDQIGYNAIKDEMCRQLGVDGVVFGCLNADGTFDLEKNRYLIECSRGMSVTCHRAFDRAVNPE